MANRPRFWADLTTRDFAALDPAATVAVLPVAATEQHGPHLPLSVDQVLVDGVVQSCLPHLGVDLPVLFLPTQPIGYSPEHSRFPGTLTLSSDSGRCGPCCSVAATGRTATVAAGSSAAKSRVVRSAQKRGRVAMAAS